MKSRFDRGVLFIGHDASRTGAPLLLLELVRWIKRHSSINPAVFLKSGGELEADYLEVAPIRTLLNEFEKLNGGLPRRALRKLRLSTIRQPDYSRLYPPARYPVVYANTIDCCDVALQLTGSGRRIIHHIHELAYTTNLFGATEKLKRAVAVTDFYIAASHAVRDFLENSIGVPAAKIQVIHEFPIATVNNSGGKSRQAIRQQLGISDDALVVGMCGLPQWRKGTDLFVQLALHMKRLPMAVKYHFVWLGGNATSQREALHDVAQTGLQDICHFVPAVASPDAYFGAFDLFALTSREDPFPVAMLEAAASGLPIVCFADAGGAAELVANDAGIVVPYLDVPAMAKACADLLVDDSRRIHLGKSAQAKVMERYTLAKQGPKILGVIEAAMCLAQ